MTVCEADATALEDGVSVRERPSRCESARSGRFLCGRSRRFAARPWRCRVALAEAGEPFELTISLGTWWKAQSNRSSGRDPRGLEECVVAVHAPMLTHRVAERYSTICCKSRDSGTAEYGLRKITTVDGSVRSALAFDQFRPLAMPPECRQHKRSGPVGDRPTRQGRLQDSRIRQAACQSAVLIRTSSLIFRILRVRTSRCVRLR
jgi:hypothetical protein